MSIQINLLKRKLIANESSYVFAVRSTHHAGIVALAQAAQYEGIYIDFQHSSIELSSAANIYQAALHAGITVLTRVPCLDPTMIGRIIDSGGQGIMLADIRNGIQANSFVKSALLSPQGDRSLGLPIDPRFHELKGQELMSEINNSTLLIGMIESEEGIENVGEIVSTKGLDAIQIGSQDLTASMGIPGEFNNERLKSAYKKVALACKSVSKPFIIGGIRKPEELRPYLMMGASKCYFTGSDTGFMLEGARLAREQASLITPVFPVQC